MAPKPQPIRMTSGTAQRIIREAAKKSQLIFFSKHAYKKMMERHITQTQVITVLRGGNVSSRPVPSLNKDDSDWTCEVVGWSAGEHLKIVVGIENDEDGVLVITCFNL